MANLYCFSNYKPSIPVFNQHVLRWQYSRECLPYIVPDLRRKSHIKTESLMSKCWTSPWSKALHAGSDKANRVSDLSLTPEHFLLSDRQLSYSHFKQTQLSKARYRGTSITCTVYRSTAKIYFRQPLLSAPVLARKKLFTEILQQYF